MQRLLLIILIAGSYLLFAGGPAWTLGPLLGIAAAGVLVAPGRTLSFRHAFRPLDTSLIALAAAIALQALPMPASSTAALSPHALTLKTSLALPQFGGRSLEWATLSIAPHATLISLGTVVLGILAFWVARAAFGGGGATRLCCRWLAFVGAVAAAAAILQRTVSPRLLLFVLEPDAMSANPFGAFINRNHFAGWLLMAGTPVVGYLIAQLRIHPVRGHRVGKIVRELATSGVVLTMPAAIMIFGTLLLTLSRSAVAGVAAAALTGWYFGRSRMTLERDRLPAMLGLIGVAVVVALFFVDIEGWATRIEQTLTVIPGFSRLTIWRETIPIVRDFWLTGTGAGTYSDAMTLYQQTHMWVGSMHRWALFNTAHSHYFQVLAEGGVLLTVPVIAAIASAVSLGRRSIRADKGEVFWIRVGAAAGLAGIAVQSLWEVSLIMPANAVLIGVLAALVVHQRDASRHEPTAPVLLRSRKAF